MKFNTTPPQVYRDHDFLYATYSSETSTTYHNDDRTEEIRKTGWFSREKTVIITRSGKSQETIFRLHVQRPIKKEDPSDDGRCWSNSISRDLVLTYNNKATMLKDFRKVCAIIG